MACCLIRSCISQILTQPSVSSRFKKCINELSLGMLFSERRKRLISYLFIYGSLVRYDVPQASLELLVLF